jgi:hypothetical protein
MGATLRNKIDRPGCLHCSSHAATSASTNRTYRPSRTQGIAPLLDDSRTQDTGTASSSATSFASRRPLRHAASP